MTEHPVLDLVPLVGAGRGMANPNRHAQLVRKLHRSEYTYCSDIFAYRLNLRGEDERGVIHRLGFMRRQARRPGIRRNTLCRKLRTAMP